MRKIIIDTDPGHDDCLAIMLAVKSNEFEIEALTTVAGNSSIENTTRNAKYILKLLGREDIPIYSGAAKPLKKELIMAVVHGESGLAGIDFEKENISSQLTNDASDKILEIVKNNPNEITLVALGPLTNIALAIEKNLEIMKKVKEIVMMGGAIRVAGNKNRVAEFNIFVDPDAANIVFNFPIRKSLIPLDACNQVKLTEEDFKKITNPSLRQPILDMMGEFMGGIYNNELGERVALVYDALTVYYLLNPDACKTEFLDIKIETSSELTRGMTVADLRPVSNKNPDIKVINYINCNKFMEDFIRILSEETLINAENITKSLKEENKKW